MRNVTLHKFGLLGVFCVLSLIKPVFTVSLRTYATLILGETPFPEFSVVLMFDDFQVGYYDRDSKYVPRRYKASWERESEAQEDAGAIFKRFYDGMKTRAKHMETCLNITENINVFQRLAACEMVDNVPGLSEGKNVFNGLIEEEMIIDVQNDQFHIERPLPSDCYVLSADHAKSLPVHVYHPICMKYLTKFLKEQEMHNMMRVKPEVRLLKKSLTDSRGVRVTCLATGFYPRHINVTLLRDDQPVSEDQVTGGILLPNADGTYQIRKSVEVNTEELRQHKYSCRVIHLSLNTSLDISSDGHDFPATVSIIICVAVALFVLAMICISFIIWRKHAGCEHLCRGKYSAPSATTENNPSAE